MKKEINKKIALISSSCFPSKGGTEKQLYLSSKYLIKQEKLFCVITRNDNENIKNSFYEGIEIIKISLPLLYNKIKNKIVRNNVSITWYESEKNKNKKYFNRMYSSLNQIIESFFLSFPILLFYLKNNKQFSAIFTFIASPFEILFIFYGKLLGIRTIARVSSSKDYMFSNIKINIYKKIFLKADYFLAISSTIEEDLLKLGVEQNKILRIPNIVTIPNLSWSSENSKKYDALVVGNLSQQPLKGIDVLLKAWRIVVENKKNAILAICGNGSSESLSILAKNLGIMSNVIFLGHCEDVYSMMSESNIFVLPSRYEGLSNALLEAMAFGMPCVATSISGNIDLIIQGETGLLVPSEDYETMAQKIVELMTDSKLQSYLGQNAYKKVKNEFSLAAFEDQINKIL